MSLLETLVEYAVKIMAWAGGILLIAALIAFLALISRYTCNKHHNE